MARSREPQKCTCRGNRQCNYCAWAEGQRERYDQALAANAAKGSNGFLEGIAKGIVTVFGITNAVVTTNVADFQPGQQGTFDGNWADSSIDRQADKTSADIDEGTRDKSNRTGWSGQRP